MPDDARMTAPPTVVLLGTLDTKGPEHAYVRDRLLEAGVQVTLVDVGILDAPTVEPDVAAHEVALAAGITIDELREAGERALSHLGARDADDHRVVGLHHDPGIDLRRPRGLRRSLPGERHVEADDEAAGHRGGTAQEASTRRAVQRAGRRSIGRVGARRHVAIAHVALPSVVSAATCSIARPAGFASPPPQQKYIYPGDQRAYYVNAQKRRAQMMKQRRAATKKYYSGYASNY